MHRRANIERQYRRHSALWPIAFAILLTSCQSTPPAVPSEAEAPAEAAESGLQHFEDDEARVYEAGEAPKRIILFVGDGMGLSAVAASSYAAGHPLTMTQMPEFGLMTTHEYEFVTTDSAASATAMATGQKTHFNGVSVVPGTGPDEVEEPERQFRTMVEAAKEADWNTGLVATVRINHATPAPFAAYADQRGRYSDIARRMSTAGVDVLLGAGSGYFNQREDGRDLLAKMEERGYTVVDDAEGVRRASTEASRLVGLLHERDMPWVHTGERKMELDEMVEHSLKVLDRDDPEGFFLMVEGAKIDWGGHRMDGEKVIDETRDMDRAVAAALEYARERNDTLVAVTADHETGAMHVVDGATADAYLKMLGGAERAFEKTVPDDLDEEIADGLAGPFAAVALGDEERFGPGEASGERLVTSFGYFSAASRARWDGEGRFSAIHTPEVVPVFAEGPGAAQITSVRDNADFGRRLLGWIDGGEPDVDSAPPVASNEDSEQPKNVVFLVADGLGTASLTASYYHHGTPAMFGLPRMAAVSTHSLDTLAADRAASATALASGHRTRSGVLGMAPGADGDLVEVASVFREAVRHGRCVGMVTTAPLTDALPAAFYARAEMADDGEAVAHQLVEFLRGEGAPSVGFVAGGGAEYFGERRRQMLSEAGYEVVDGWRAAGAQDGASVVLESDSVPDAPTRRGDEDTPTLAEMTQSALEALDGTDEGFLLVVGAGPGAAKRKMERGPGLVDEVREFDEAVRVADEFAAADGDTLVVATSTHDKTLSVQDNHYGFHAGRCGVATECGGDFTLDWMEVQSEAIRHGEGLENAALQGEYSPPKIALHYTWLAQKLEQRGEGVHSPRSANFVPLFAGGVGASQFGGLIDQPRLGQWLVGWAAEGAANAGVD